MGQLVHCVAMRQPEGKTSGHGMADGVETSYQQRHERAEDRLVETKDG